MCRLLFVVVSLLLTAPAMAQTVVADFTVPPELAEPYQFVSGQQVEADGNPNTIEWLLHMEGPPSPPCIDMHGNPCIPYKPASLERYRVVAIRDGQYCKGPWFRPHPYAHDATITLGFDGRRHRFIVDWSLTIRWPIDSNTFETISGTRIVGLDVPTCQ